MTTKARLINDLRGAVASAIANYKAYDVPRVCVRLGLSPGEESEAFNSKYRYALSRMQEVPAADVSGVANRLMEDGDNPAVAELLAKIEELEQPKLSELNRRRIIALFDGRPLCTELDEIEFIRRVWDIAAMPSPYAGKGWNSGTMEDAVIQHTIRNDDWTHRELLEHMGLLTCSQRQFFRFLEQVTHPIVQDAPSQALIVKQINEHLQTEGFSLHVIERMAGSPIYAVQAKALGSPADRNISTVLEAFNPEAVHKRWEAALERRSTDPEGAITLSRTLLEDVCKWLIVEEGGDYEEKDELPTLYKKLAAKINLAPDLHTEQVFKQILGSCQSIVESLGALRNKLGDAHSEGPRRAKPSARHAELAVNLAGSMATFLVSTWRSRKNSKAA